MINKVSAVNSISNVLNLKNLSFKSENTNNLIEVKEQEQTNMQALTNYWTASINLDKKYELKPLESRLMKDNKVDSLAGEKIYYSNGELHSIVDKNEETTTYYYPSVIEEGLIDTMLVEDNKTKKIILKEFADLEDGKIVSMSIVKYSPQTGESVAYTRYEGDELKYHSKTNYLENGYIEEINYDKEYNEYNVSREHPTKNISENINYKNGLKNVIYSTTNEVKKNTVVDKEYEFYNGSLISMREYKKVLFPNFIAQEALMDKDLQPHEKVDLSKYGADMEGNRTYYSNGAIETIVNDDTTVKFSPKGFIKEIITPEFILTSDYEGGQTITENIDDNTTKITSHYSDGAVDVEFISGDSYKLVWLDSKSRLYHYSDGKFDSEGDRIKDKDYWYKNGMLETVY